MPLKRKAAAVQPGPAKVKHLKRQSDLRAGLASQLLKSPQKKKHHVPSASQSSGRSLEVEDEIEISSDEDQLQNTQIRGTQSCPRTYSSQNIIQTQLKNGLKHIKLELVEEIPVDNSHEDGLTIIQGADEYGSLSALENSRPRRLTELAVNKTKIAEVQRWITSAFDEIVKHTVLILTGSAGVGKTATVETLALEMDFDILEWKNPMSSDWSEHSFDRDTDSLAQKFERFLAVSDKYSTLDFGQGYTHDTKRKIILIEDLPNTFSSSSGTSSAKLAFQETLKRYLASPLHKYPLILIITETEPRGEDNDWRCSDAMSLRTLMTREILDSPNCKQIQFNDIAPTFITKALARIVDNLPRSEALDVSQAVLEEIAQNANGDIRSAVNTLQFIAHKFSTNGKAPRARSRKRRSEVLTLTTDESSILSIVTNRESALGYFHAIGKVIYNKRLPSSSSSTTAYDALPEHLALESRLRPENNPSSILEVTSTDIPTFLMGIHQNYLDSCSDTEQAANAIDGLSEADYLTHGFFNSTSSSAPVLQIQIAGVLAVSHVMHSLPQNVRRKHSAKVYFPAFSKLLHAQRTNQDLIEIYNNNKFGSSSRSSSSDVNHVSVIETMSFAWQIAQSRRSTQDMQQYRKVVQMNRFTSLGRGGFDETTGLINETEGESVNKHSNSKQQFDVNKRDDDGEELNDDIEEVD